VSGFLAVDEMRSRAVRLARPVAVVDFIDEKGARFGVCCLGSRLMWGTLAPEQARGLTDADGMTLAEAMHGADPDGIGRGEQALARLGQLVEVHVEQGRNLVGLDASVAIASAMWPHRAWLFTLTGESDHVGTTRLGDRRDPALPFASDVLAARQVAQDNGTRGAFSKSTVAAGGSNVIATTVTAWLDARGRTGGAMARSVEQIAAARAAAAEHDVHVEMTRTSYASGVNFSTDLRQLHAKLGADYGNPMPESPTQGHDCGVLAQEIPTSMLLVRSPSGICRSPGEFAQTDDVLDGTAAPSRFLEALATRE
jgi:beta-ureidopropionase / N-carbamoyl-L-amino-acid hydrolase